MENTEKKNIKNIDFSKYKILNEEYVFEEIAGEVKDVKLIYLEKDNKYYKNLKKAAYKYNERNREKINEQKKIRSNERYQNDEEFREKQKEKQRQYYLRKKEKKE